MKICSEVVSRSISLQNSQNVSKKTSKKIERIKRQNDIVREFQNLTEVSIILENQLNTDTSDLIPTVCRDRFDHLDNFHASEQNIFTDSVDEIFDESYDDITIVDLDEIAAIISKGYEDIIESNSSIRSKEDQIDLLINGVLKRKSYRAFEELMTPFLEIQGVDMQVDTLLLAAKFIPFVPKIAANIQYWVTSNLSISTNDLLDYNKALLAMERSSTFHYREIDICHLKKNQMSSLVLMTTAVGDIA